jgi:hypothetical protein
MRTKTLLLSAAVVAAGLVSSIAQSNVYSVNIVGYVNKNSALGFSAHANPLNANISDAANNVINNSSGQWDGSSVYLFNGVNFVVYLIDSSSGTGYTDLGGNPIAAPILSPGKGYLFNNQVSSNVLTYVGTVTGSIASTVLSNNFTLPSSPLNNLVGSPLPLGGGISTALKLDNSTGQLDGDAVQIPNIVGGNLVSYTLRLFDSSSGTGFTDVGGNPVPEPQIAVGSSFLFVNNNATPASWNQVVNVGP